MREQQNLKFQNIENWLKPIQQPLLISGPCSAESREQVLQAARLLKETGLVSAFRSGIWKPRSRPNSFEGHGEKALDWLREVHEKYGFPLVVEVANPRHVEACLKAGIHILWVGARTTVNPFSVQELADVLKGTATPLLIKNPVNPDLELWIGVIERFYMSGITKLAAVHRGFTTFGKMRMRNEPIWEIPIELKRIFPNLPVLCDPSHIGGNRNLLEEISQQALLLGMDGLMIESHPHPEQALTDAAQQINPTELAEMVRKLKTLSPDLNPCLELEALRNKIDDIDNRLLEILQQRMRTVQEIGRLKKDCKMTVLQIQRWNEIIESRIKKGTRLGMRKGFMKDLLGIIHKESIHLQSQFIKNTEK